MKKAMRKIDKDDMRELVRAIKQFNQDTKDEQVAGETSKLTTKDILFYYLTQHQLMCERVDKLETTVKMLMWFMGIALSMITIGIGIFKL